MEGHDAKNNGLEGAAVRVLVELLAEAVARVENVDQGEDVDLLLEGLESKGEGHAVGDRVLVPALLGEFGEEAVDTGLIELYS